MPSATFSLASLTRSMDRFLVWFGAGLSAGLGSGLVAFLCGRVVRRSFGLIGRGLLMR